MRRDHAYAPRQPQQLGRDHHHDDARQQYAADSGDNRPRLGSQRSEPGGEANKHEHERVHEKAGVLPQVVQEPASALRHANLPSVAAVDQARGHARQCAGRLERLRGKVAAVCQRGRERHLDHVVVDDGRHA